MPLGEPAVGATGVVTKVIERADLASAFQVGPGDVYADVLATPRMISLMETSADRVLTPFLEKRRPTTAAATMATATTATASAGAPAISGEAVAATVAAPASSAPAPDDRPGSGDVTDKSVGHIELSVGVGVDIVHVAAAALGDTVSAKSTYLGRRGKLYCFRIVASNGAGTVIGHGEHTRAIITVDRLLKGAAKRKAVKL